MKLNISNTLENKVTVLDSNVCYIVGISFPYKVNTNRKLKLELSDLPGASDWYGEFKRA